MDALRGSILDFGFWILDLLHLRPNSKSKIGVPFGPPKSRTRRLGRPERALAEALDQLGRGVPLNWTQIVDDPELIVLASLQKAALECREKPYSTPPELRHDLFEELSVRLPEPRPEPVKAQPKSLAGYSESVYVPTQAEEDVPALTPTLLPRVAMGGAAVVALALLFWIVGPLVAGLLPTPSYTWISARKNGQSVYRQTLPAGWAAPSCTGGFEASDPSAKRHFITFPDKSQLQLYVGFPVQYLPTIVPLSATYTLGVTDQAVSPCALDTPDPGDLGEVVKLNYVARTQTDPGSSSTAPITVFEAKQLPATIDAGSGQVKEVKIGDMHGIYWRGAPYQDLEGTHWIGDVSVMMLEKGDIVLTIVGEVRQGATEEMLTGLVKQMGEVQKQQAGQAVPAFTWIEVSKGKTVLAAREPAANPAQLDCRPDGRAGWNFIRGGASSLTEPFLGYPIISLPETTTITGTIQAQHEILQPSPTPPITVLIPTSALLTYTADLVSGSIRPCAGLDLQSSDPGAKLKQRYALRQTSSYIDNGQTVQQTIPAADVVTFQMHRQPARIDLAGGTWNEVRAGDAHGIFWTGSPYTDMEGIPWTGDVSMLVVEKGDTVIILEGSVNPVSINGGAAIQGMSEGLLVALLKGMK
jgi:hypothetical protein